MRIYLLCLKGPPLRVNISLQNPQSLPAPCLNGNLAAQPSPQPTQEPMLILPHIPSLRIGISLFLIPQCCCLDLSLPPSGKTLFSITDHASLIPHHYWLPASIHTSLTNQTHGKQLRLSTFFLPSSWLQYPLGQPTHHTVLLILSILIFQCLQL